MLFSGCRGFVCYVKQILCNMVLWLLFCVGVYSSVNFSVYVGLSLFFSCRVSGVVLGVVVFPFVGVVCRWC